MDIQTRLQDLFRVVFDAPNLEIRPDMTAGDVEKWDSLTHLLMIERVEVEFQIKFKLKELIKLKNVGDLMQLIQEKIT
jgi:acyl carrier protein